MIGFLLSFLWELNFRIYFYPNWREGRCFSLLVLCGHIFWEANYTYITVPAIVKAEEKIVSEPASGKTEEKKVPAELVISKTEEKIVPEPASGNNADKTVPKPATNVDKTVPEEGAKTVPAEPAKTVPEPAKTVSESAKTVPAEPAKTVPEPAIAKNEDETVVPVHKVGLRCHGIEVGSCVSSTFKRCTPVLNWSE